MGAARTYDVDGNMEFDSFAPDFARTEDGQTGFDLAPTHDGFVVVYGYRSFSGNAVGIERDFDELTYVFGTVTSTGVFKPPQISVNLLPRNDGIFIAYENRDRARPDALVVDGNDNFPATLRAVDPAMIADRLRIDAAIVLSNGNLALLLWNDGNDVVKGGAGNDALNGEDGKDRPTGLVDRP